MEIIRDGDVAVLTMRGGKGNAMSRELLARFETLLVEAARAPAIVITGDGAFFSGGLALPPLVELDRAGMRELIDLFGRAMLAVFRCQRPVVAAVNGHAIAGGCVLALQCDVRIMAAGAAKIGLNEVQLGIGLPASVIEPLRLAVPPPSLRPLALEGRLVDPGEALRLGLVDEVVSPAELLPRALVRARELLTGGAAAYAQIKAALRRPALEAWLAHSDEERERWLDTWFGEPARTRLKEIAARLRK